MDTLLIACFGFLFGIGVLLQILTPAIFPDRAANQNGAILSMLFLAAGTMVGLWAFDSKYLPLLGIWAVYQIWNAVILYAWRYHPLRSRKQVQRSALMVTLTTVLIAGLINLGVFTLLNANILAFIVSASICLRASTWLNKSISRPKLMAEKAKQPTVTMAIPARNETHALTQHLRSVVDTKYKKIEFLVADDCSQDDTSQIIRSFAHDGVRFIQGIAPEGSWIGKNRAYQALSEAASGEFIIFSGVDTRYERDSIETLIEHMRKNKLDMVSVLPTHRELRGMGAIVQPMRYLSQIVTSSSKRPPVFSTVWVIRSKALEKLGGFKSAENSILPEKHFARQLAFKGKYEFISGSRSIGITTLKKPSSQKDTAVRTIYPQLKKYVYKHYFVTLAFVLLAVLPVLTLTMRAPQHDTARIFALATGALLFITYVMLIARSYNAWQLIFAPITFIAGLVYFYALSVASMYGYERDTVTWKGRNICEPVMLHSLLKK